MESSAVINWALVGAIEAIQKQIKSQEWGDDINRGGCARFAIRAHRALNKLGIENHMCVELGSHNDNVKKNKRQIANWRTLNPDQRDNLSFAHTFIHIPQINYCFDGKYLGKGGPDEFSEDGIDCTYTEQEMKVVIRLGWWNWAYKPANNPALSKIIYSTFRKLDKYKL